MGRSAAVLSFLRGLWLVCCAVGVHSGVTQGCDAQPRGAREIDDGDDEMGWVGEEPFQLGGVIEVEIVSREFFARSAPPRFALQVDARSTRR